MQGKENPQIPAQHQEATFQLMQLFSLDITDAYKYLQSMHFQLEAAISHRLDPRSIHSSPYQRFNHSPSPSDYKQFFHQSNLIDIIGHSNKSKPIKSKSDSINEKKNYSKTYLIKKNRAPRNKSRNRRVKINEEIDSKAKIIEQFNFVDSLQKLIKNEVHVSFRPESYDAFLQLWQDRKLIAIHCIHFLDQKQQHDTTMQSIMNFTRQIYLKTSFIEAFNKYFINFGIDPTRFDFSHFSFLKQFISEGDQYSIIVLRYDETQQKVTILKKLPFSQNFKFSSPQLFTVLAQQLQHQNNQLKWRAQNKPEEMSISQKKRLEEDRKIRQIQEQQYFKHLEVPENSNDKPIEDQRQRIDIEQLRRKNRESLTAYSDDIEDAISLKIKLLNSQFLYCKLPKTQKIQYIFQLIQNSERELGFDDEISRHFDIILPLQRTSLAERKLETFQHIFGQSKMELLVVKQL